MYVRGSRASREQGPYAAEAEAERGKCRSSLQLCMLTMQRASQALSGALKAGALDFRGASYRDRSL
jgi:hypothetical protein